jgi:hypothetical protein
VPILECKPAKVGYKPAKPWAQEDQEGELLIPGILPEEGSGRSQGLGPEPRDPRDPAKSLWYIDTLMEQLRELLHGQLNYIVWNYNTALHRS